MDMDARSEKERWEFIQRHREMQTLHADQMLDPRSVECPKEVLFGVYHDQQRRANICSGHQGYTTRERSSRNNAFRKRLAGEGYDVEEEGDWQALYPVRACRHS